MSAPTPAVGGVRVSTRGLRELKKAMREAGVTVEEMTATNEAAAELVYREALPHTPHGATGRLEAVMRTRKNKTSGTVVDGGFGVRYAKAIHWGVKAREGLKGPHNIPRRAWIWEALVRRRNEVLGVYVASLNVALARAAATINNASETDES